ncbi:MAG: malate dehydrogenase (oxaloacetate-decarboxylating) [Limisphaerales bacterium]|jgi:malate dehydrogenase (oxaloacetate-decarboxylating)
MKDYFEESVKLHRKLGGKISIQNKIEVDSNEVLSLVYSPGVAQPCLEIQKDNDLAYELTMKGNSVAVVTDGSAVLGLGNIGPYAAIPVMEGKAMLFKKFADINAFPICLDTQDTEEIIATVKRIAPAFGGINLEDISAPRSFEIESRLQDIGIPVFHDDQHGTAIVVLAGMLNSAKILGKSLDQMKVVINGAGAAGIAIARLLRCINLEEDSCLAVRNLIACDSKGIISNTRTDLNESKLELLKYSNPHNVSGTLRDALIDADAFIGVSMANLLTAKDIATMATDPVIFALANPTPEIMPEEAYKGGAAIVATGRSDFPNQVNNVLAFPGIFRGALDSRAPRITAQMKLAAAHAIADCVPNPSREEIIPSSLNMEVATKVAESIKSVCSAKFTAPQPV